MPAVADNQDARPTWRIIQGDVRESLRGLPDASVHMCVTSPPYFGLRDYGTAAWDGGDSACEHKAPPSGGLVKGSALVGTGNRDGFSADGQYRGECRKCGATRIDSQIGLEPSLDDYIAALVGVFREVKRVLRDDGSLFLNLGDSYNAASENGKTRAEYGFQPKQATNPHAGIVARRSVNGLKQKDLMGVPWSVAFALRADGWYLRSDIIWAKPNPMPESVTDRPTKAHEYIFLLTKSARYFFDAEAVKEKFADEPNGNPGNYHNGYSDGAGRNDSDTKGKEWNLDGSASGRNARSVWRPVDDLWTISTQSYSEAHFATFPEAIPERCIKAGTSERGCCPECGAPWARVTTKDRKPSRPGANTKCRVVDDHRLQGNRDPERHVTETRTVGWEPGCDCPAHEAVPCTVLEPFAGSGTTLAVAMKLGRSAIGCELNPAYIEIANKRIGQATRPNTHRTDEVGDAALFAAPTARTPHQDQDAK